MGKPSAVRKLLINSDLAGQEQNAHRMNNVKNVIDESEVNLSWTL